jgi:hypothetical protein
MSVVIASTSSTQFCLVDRDKVGLGGNTAVGKERDVFNVIFRIINGNSLCSLSVGERLLAS